MRGLSFILGCCVIAVGIGVLLFFFGPASLQSQVNNSLQSAQGLGTTTVPFVVLEQGQDAISIPSRTNYRITTESDLQNLWPIVYGERDAPQIPSVDFSKYEVLGIFDGTHSTGGYGVQVESIVDANSMRTVTIEHSLPGSSCASIVGASSPFEIIRVPKTSFSIAHTDLTETTACAGN